jgi:outer membrane lipoprotein-sorting protein
MMQDMVEYRNQARTDDSYFMEGVTSIFENNKLVSKETMKRWYDNRTGKERLETIAEGEPTQFSVDNGVNRIVYREGDNIALVMESSSVMNQNPEPMVHSIVQMLQQFTNTHRIHLVGEEKIAGSQTYHLSLKANQSNAIDGDKEIWIDQDTWMIKKIISVIGNERQESLFYSYESNPNLKDKFNLELPNHVKMLEDTMTSQPISLEEVKTMLGENAYFVPETENLQLSFIEEKNEVFTLSYMKESQLYFMVSMRKSSEINTEPQNGIRIRESSAKLEKDKGNGYTLTWYEKGIQYTIYDFANVLEKEELLKIAGSMEQN